MAVIMLDARKRFFQNLRIPGIWWHARYMERVYGSHDVEVADDTILINCHLMSLRVLTSCYLRESYYYGFQANNHPVDSKCYLIAINPDIREPRRQE